MKKVTPKVINTIETELDGVGVEVNLERWNETDDDVIIYDQNKLAEELKISPELASALAMLINSLTEKFLAINRDLKDLGSKVL